MLTADVLTLCKCHIILSQGLEYLWLLISRGTFNQPLRYRKLERMYQGMTVSIRVTVAVKTRGEYKAVGCSRLALPKAPGDAQLEYRVAQSRATRGRAGIPRQTSEVQDPVMSQDSHADSWHRTRERAGKDVGPRDRPSSR